MNGPVKHVMHIQWKCLGFGKLLCSHTHSSALLMDTFSSSSPCRFYACFKALAIKWQERLAPPSLPPSHSIHDLFVPQTPGRLRIPSSALSSHFKFPSLVTSTYQVTNSMKMPLKFVSTPRLFYGPNCLKNIAFCVFLRHLNVRAQASPCKPVPCPPVPASVSSLYPGHCLRLI